MPRRYPGVFGRVDKSYGKVQQPLTRPYRPVLHAEAGWQLLVNTQVFRLSGLECGEGAHPEWNQRARLHDRDRTRSDRGRSRLCFPGTRFPH